MNALRLGRLVQVAAPALATVALAVAWLASPAVAAPTDLGRAVGEASLVRKFCPTLELDEAARESRMKSEGVDAANPGFQQGVVQGVLGGTQMESAQGRQAFCKAMSDRYGANGTVLRGLVKVK